MPIGPGRPAATAALAVSFQSVTTSALAMPIQAVPARTAAQVTLCSFFNMLPPRFDLGAETATDSGDSMPGQLRPGTNESPDEKLIFGR